MQGETIAAIATAPGAAGVGIVRVSGAGALDVAERAFRTASGKSARELRSQQAAYGHVVEASGENIDEALLLVMRAPHSYTMEDVVELQCHGGSVVLRRVLSRVLAAGARLATRGEFTKRAFLNGRLDLSEAQAVMEIVGARTDRALQMAEGHLAGDFSGKIHAMRTHCLALVAHMEAAIDFPEDGVDEVLLDDVEKQVTAMRQEIRRLLATAHTGKILRDGLMTAIVGRPNVGKSSLLNALLGEERAIVTDIPGTTRDSIEEQADIGGVPLRIIDTAGIRETQDTVEKIGVARAEQYIEKAALVLALFDGSATLMAEDEKILALLAGKKAIVLLTKSDLPQKLKAADIQAKNFAPLAVLPISTKTGAGLEKLTEEIQKFAGLGAETEAGFVSSERDAALLREADTHLKAALETIGAGLALDFVSIDLRSALDKLGEITGETAGEAVIDEIFSRFCIGK